MQRFCRHWCIELGSWTAFRMQGSLHWGGFCCDFTAKTAWGKQRFLRIWVKSRSPGAQGWLKWKRLCPLRLQPKTRHSASLDSRHRHHALQRSHTCKYSHSTSCADSHRALVCEGWRHGGVVFGCLDHWWPMCFMIVRKRSPKVIILHMSDLNCNGALLSHLFTHSFCCMLKVKSQFSFGQVDIWH